MRSQSATLITPKQRQSVLSHIILPTTTPLTHDSLNDYETNEDNILMDVLHIRNEIINKTMDICYSNYLQRQVIKFLVQCSYEAWQRILRLNFYPHDTRMEFYQTYQKFGQDKHPLPSTPDTWAANTVQIYDPLFKESDGDIASSNEDIEAAKTFGPDVSAVPGGGSTGISRGSTLHINYSDISNAISATFTVNPEEQTGGIPVPNPSEASFEKEHSWTSVSKTPSYFTSITMTAPKPEGIAPVLSKINAHKGRISTQKLAKKAQHICNDTQHPKNIQLEDLPPVRAPTTFKYNVFTEEEKKKFETKKKPHYN